LRALDPAERYFWLLGQVSGASSVYFAELDRRLDRRRLAEGIGVLLRRHPLLRARVEVVDAEFTFVEASDEVVVTEIPLREGESPSIGEMFRPFDPSPSPLVRCIYQPVEGRERSVLLLVMHHAFIDGLAGMRAMQQLLRWMDHHDAPSDPVSRSVPVPVHERFPPELRSPRAALDVLASIRAERAGQPAPETFAFHGRGVTACHPRYDQLALDPQATAALLARARAAGATIFGQLSAAVLEAGAALLSDEGVHLISLASATDLRARSDPPLPLDDMQLAIGMLCTPYLVSGGTNATLARQIGEQTRREAARGESHLFYRFARTAAYPASEEGIDSFARWLDAAPRNLTVSNLGRIDDTGDPPWVRTLVSALPAGPNQVAFVAATTYRDKLALTVTTDLARLPVALAERLVAGIAERLGARRTFSSADGVGAAG
jgi:hypothetical protein